MIALPGVAPGRWLRPARPDDVPAISRLINGYAARGLMLPKTEEELLDALGRYRVVVDPSGVLCACGGLRRWSPGTAEVVGLAVVPERAGEGLGSTLVAHLVDRARAEGAARVFAMTLRPGFFARHGFGPVPRGFFPEKEGLDCASCPWRDACREVAMARILLPTAPREGCAPHPELTRYSQRV